MLNLELIYSHWMSLLSNVYWELIYYDKRTMKNYVLLFALENQMLIQHLIFFAEWNAEISKRKCFRGVNWEQGHKAPSTIVAGNVY